MKTTTDTKLSFAVIGCGVISRSQHIPNLLNSKKASLHTCVDLDDAILKECREKFGVKETSKDFRAVIRDHEIQAICLATTEHLRLPVIDAAAEAGKPIYVEKPLGRSLEEIYKIRQIVKQSGIKLCVGHNRRCSPAMIEAHRIFRPHMKHPAPCHWRWDREGAARPKLKEDGVAGMSVRINDDWWSWKGWAMDKNYSPEGAMLFEMTHFTDMCNWFLDAEPVEVIAMESDMLHHGVVIRYATGEMATISMSDNGTFGYPKELYEMMGNGAVVAVDHMVEVRTVGIDGAPPRITYPMKADRHPQIGTEGGISGWLAKKRAACEEAAAKHNPMLQFTAEPDKGHSSALDRFVDEINGVGPQVCGVDSAIAATRIAFAAIKSAKEHRAVKLEEV